MIMHGIIVSLSILLVRHDIPYYSYGVGFCNLLVLLEGQVLRPGSWDEQVRSPTSFLYMQQNFSETNQRLSLGVGRMHKTILNVWGKQIILNFLRHSLMWRLQLSVAGRQSSHCIFCCLPSQSSSCGFSLWGSFSSLHGVQK